jgi:LynF/TruF/PatF family peptide O-prenyltransferase
MFLPAGKPHSLHDIGSQGPMVSQNDTTMAPETSYKGIEQVRRMNPLLRMYEFHRKEFGVENKAFIRLVEEFLARPSCSLLECSVKISPRGTHAQRVRFGYEQEYVPEGLSLIHHFLERISNYNNVKLNRDILSQIVDKGLDVSRVMAAGIGLDYRKRMKDSKVKCYFMIKDYPDKVNQVLSVHMPVDGIDNYPMHDVFMFGIDMYFDGNTGVEIYPFLDGQNLRNAELMDKLRLQKTIDWLIEECNLLHISFDSRGKRILHFHPLNTSRFVRVIGNRQLNVYYGNVRILNYLLNRSYRKVLFSVNLSLVEDELLSKKIQNINLQYGLTSRDWQD